MAKEQGLPLKCADRLRETVLGPYLSAFRHALVGEPPARVGSMVVRRQLGPVSVRAWPRAFRPAKAACLKEHFGQLEAAGMVVRNPQATFSSVAMAVRKGTSFWMVADYRAVNRFVAQSTLLMPRKEQLRALVGGAAAF